MATVTNTRGFTNTAGSATTGFTWSSNAMDITNVSNPPTEAEIIAIFGTAAAVGSGFVGYIDDAGGGVNVYMVTSTGTKYTQTILTIAS